MQRKDEPGQQMAATERVPAAERDLIARRPAAILEHQAKARAQPCVNGEIKRRNQRNLGGTTEMFKAFVPCIGMRA